MLTEHVCMIPLTKQIQCSNAILTLTLHRHWMPALDALFISRRLLILFNSLFCFYLSITQTLTLTLSDFELQWQLQWLKCLVSSYLQ